MQHNHLVPAADIHPEVDIPEAVDHTAHQSAVRHHILLEQDHHTRLEGRHTRLGARRNLQKGHRIRWAEEHCLDSRLCGRRSCQ